MRKFVVGDIHGRLNAFNDVLEQAGFDNEKDMLISLGDLYDGFAGYGSYKGVIERFMQIKNRIWVRGNHDAWVGKWFDHSFSGSAEEIAWLSQGGYNSRSDYIKDDGTLDEELIARHRDEYHKSVLYHIDEDNNLFVHGGINWKYPIDEQPVKPPVFRGDYTKYAPYIYYWDRHTYEVAQIWDKQGHKFPYKTVFIGHTATKNTVPIQTANLWNIDQGAGHGGRLTLMEVSTFKFYQSEEPETTVTKTRFEGHDYREGIPSI